MSWLSSSHAETYCWSWGKTSRLVSTRKLMSAVSGDVVLIRIEGAPVEVTIATNHGIGIGIPARGWGQGFLVARTFETVKRIKIFEGLFGGGLFCRGEPGAVHDCWLAGVEG